MKSGGERHEKDDRHGIDDRTPYVLGWSNDVKIAALARQKRDLSTRVLAQGEQTRALKREVEKANAPYGLWQKPGVYANFAELDWKPLVSEIDGLEREQGALPASSDMLCTLQDQLRELAKARARTEAQHQASTRQQATFAESSVRHASSARSAPGLPRPSTLRLPPYFPLR